MSYRWSSNSNSHANRYHHHHVVVRQTETLVSDGEDSRYIHMNSHPPKRMDNQFSGGYGYTVLEPPQVKNPDLMMLFANDMEYNNNWVQPQHPSNWQDHRITSSLERRSRPSSFEVGYGSSRVSSGEEMVDAEADEFIRFKHRKFEQESRKGSVRAG